MIFKEYTYSVLIVSSSEKFTKAIMSLLPVNEFWPIKTVKNVGAAQRAFLEQNFDIVVINAPLPDDIGTKFAMDVCDGSDAAVLLFVKNDIFDEVHNKVIEHGVLTAPKPAPAEMVAHSLRAMCAMCQRLKKIEKKQISIEEKMEEIRLVNKAKWLLIECLGMTESEAHRHIEKTAMDTRTSRKTVAENIIKTYK